MYKFKYREIHITLTGELTVVQVRAFINFLTSEFGSSTRGERDTILKNLLYHIMLTKLKRSVHLVELQISFHLRRSGPEKLNCMPQRSKPKLLHTMVVTQLLLSVYMAHSRDPTRPFPIRQPTGLVPSKIPTPLAHSPLWGLLWQLWLSYPLRASVNCTQCLCTWTKSRIVQSPTKLSDKI